MVIQERPAGKNFGVAFFVLPAISMPQNNIVSLVNFFLPLGHPDSRRRWPFLGYKLFELGLGCKAWCADGPGQP